MTREEAMQLDLIATQKRRIYLQSRLDNEEMKSKLDQAELESRWACEREEKDRQSANEAAAIATSAWAELWAIEQGDKNDKSE